jgi:hypothetical protein
MADPNPHTFFIKDRQILRPHTHTLASLGSLEVLLLCFENVPNCVLVLNEVLEAGRDCPQPVQQGHVAGLGG